MDECPHSLTPNTFRHVLGRRNRDPEHSEMVTGVETAGLVLAAFPLVISGVQAYREGLKPLRTWWQYRTQVLELSAAIDSQHLMFLQNIELLLDPIVASSSQMNRLLKSPGTGDPVWLNSELAEKLKQRLSISYSSYTSTVLGMSKTLRDLESKLGIVDGEATPNMQHGLTIRFHKIN